MAQRETKGDLRIDRTQNLLRRAMLELLRQMSFEEITVKLLAQQATINRKTFYAHYSGKEQLLEEMFREADEALCGCLVYQKPMPDAQPDLGTDGSGPAPVPVHRGSVPRISGDPVYRQHYRHWDAGSGRGRSSRGTAACSSRRTAGGGCRCGCGMQRCYLFFSTWDWWLDQQDYTVEEGAALLCRSMLVSEAGVFRYVRAREKRPPEEQAEDK